MVSQFPRDTSTYPQSNIAKLFSLDFDLTYPMTQFRFPVIGVILYLLLIHYFQPAKEVTVKKETKKERKFGFMEKFMFVHNMLLCIFSLACFLNTGPTVFQLLQTYTWRQFFCDKFMLEFNKTYGFWSYLFYLSKFYEFIDTFIVIAKGRRPSTLQVFHHCGAIFATWLLVVARCIGGYLFVVANSFVHTVMYFYYALSLLGIEWKSKFILTMMQMFQFLIGNGIAVYQYFSFRDCQRVEDTIGTVVILAYTTALFVMFARFYNQSYIKPKSKNL